MRNAMKQDMGRRGNGADVNYCGLGEGEEACAEAEAELEGGGCGPVGKGGGGFLEGYG